MLELIGFTAKKIVCIILKKSSKIKKVGCGGKNMEKHGRIRKEEKSIKQQLNPESGFTLERERERATFIKK